MHINLDIPVLVFSKKDKHHCNTHGKVNTNNYYNIQDSQLSVFRQLSVYGISSREVDLVEGLPKVKIFLIVLWNFVNGRKSFPIASRVVVTFQQLCFHKLIFFFSLFFQFLKFFFNHKFFEFLHLQAFFRIPYQKGKGLFNTNPRFSKEVSGANDFLFPQKCSAAHVL